MVFAHVRIVPERSPHDVHPVRASGTWIGRRVGGSECELQIDDAKMSRRHVRIERVAAGWQVVDLGSRNGGFVAGQPLAPGGSALLGDGAVLRLGDTLMIFRSSGASSDPRSDAGAFPGVSPAAVAVRRRIDALAGAAGHVLVLGETGTGKERVARAIGGPRAAQPFVALNCAELTRELARSELFGHLRGAFTGATHKVGLVELAGDGVLFLDELGELALDVQADLLRFLEDGLYRPLGASELRHSNARIVAATNIDLDQAIASNGFRRDLAGRLRKDNAPLELPPLRERREDVVRWARFFLEEAGHTAPAALWTPGALECLLLYPWPENLRELRGVVRALAAEDATFPCAAERLPPRIQGHRDALRGAAPPKDEHTPLERRTPSKIEIEEALRRTQGRIRTAAQQLGIVRRQLYRLCERYGIDLAAYRAPD